MSDGKLFHAVGPLTQNCYQLFGYPAVSVLNKLSISASVKC